MPREIDERDCQNGFADSQQEEIDRLKTSLADARARVGELEEHIDTLTTVIGLTAFKHESQRAVLQKAYDAARSTLTNSIAGSHNRVKTTAQEEFFVFGFVTGESIYRLKNMGGNCRGAVPVHKERSHVAKTPVYVRIKKEV